MTESEHVSGTYPNHADATDSSDVKVAGAIQSTAYAVEVAEEKEAGADDKTGRSGAGDFRGHKGPGHGVAGHDAHHRSER